MDLNALNAKFGERYDSEPRLFRAPGRVNLIGEHTDYNDGFVLPAALDFATYVAAAVRDDRRIRVASLNFDREFEFDLDHPLQESETTWAKYVQGVGLILEREGYALRGADLLIGSDVPVGAGLSSSAALEISTSFALATLSGQQVDEMKLARIGQMAEHEYAGVHSGIMDQFASVFGQEGYALFLDCRSMEWSPVPIAARFLICNTKVKHDLAEGEYNKRRAECESAARFFGKKSLRDVSIEEFEASANRMPTTERKRARHVLYENRRVVEAVTALERNDLTTFGELIDQSHMSLRDDFEVSCPELDTMVEAARQQEGVMAARMTGGGFGGCAIALLSDNFHDNQIASIREEYVAATGIEPEFYPCTIGGGVGEIEV